MTHHGKMLIYPAGGQDGWFIVNPDDPSWRFLVERICIQIQAIGRPDGKIEVDGYLYMSKHGTAYIGRGEESD